MATSTQASLGHRHPDGSLRLATWATEGTVTYSRNLPTVPMHGAPARATPLVTNGRLGIDLIHLEAGKSFAPHTHPGDHLLIVVSGQGTVTYDGAIYPTEPGQVYLIEGGVAHAVGARSDHRILAVGSPHRAADDPDRMALVEYAAIASQLGDLVCLICKTGAPCEHCPPDGYQAPLIDQPAYQEYGP
jgi:quercetin dioxygenase-like cupin family protein